MLAVIGTHALFFPMLFYDEAIIVPFQNEHTERGFFKAFFVLF